MESRPFYTDFCKLFWDLLQAKHQRNLQILFGITRSADADSLKEAEVTDASNDEEEPTKHSWGTREEIYSHREVVFASKRQRTCEGYHQSIRVGTNRPLLNVDLATSGFIILAH